VLVREEHLRASAAVRADVAAALNALASIVVPVEVHYLWRPQVQDPDDDMVFDAAVNGRADAIVTFETATFAEAAPRFGLRVMTPAEILNSIRR
jgi:predicted nucleic acid-binding protein